jgi:plastocyanin
MTWLWRICFSVLWLLPAWCASVKGGVLLTDSRDPGVRRHQDFRDVVVWLEPATGHAPPPAASHRPQTMRQKDKQFEPHVLAVPVGGAVDFPNDDPFYHNVFSNYSGQQFDLSLYKPFTSKRMVFTSAGIVRVFCNIHPRMSAVIAVLDSPWFAVTGPSGAFEMRNVPPGKYTLHVFHERATEETLRALERPVTVENVAVLALPVVKISETGYIPAPHRNKWDKDYPPVDDQPAYGPNQ